MIHLTHDEAIACRRSLMTSRTPGNRLSRLTPAQQQFCRCFIARTCSPAMRIYLWTLC